VRVFFNYLNETEATDRPIKYKLALQDVPKRKIRMHQAGQEEKLFSRDEIKALIRTAKTAAQLSHIYLGINAAYGSADIGRLKTAAIDFENSWLGEIRGKTGVARGCWLWPETVAALRQAIDEKPWNPRYPDLYSLTRNRQPWWQEETDSNPLIASFSRNKKAASITRRGVGQYSLRHTFRTIGGDVGDREAVDYIMGHKDPSVSAGYRHGIDPKRVVAVCSHVRDWLFGDNQGAG
jgi:integrase